MKHMLCPAFEPQKPPKMSRNPKINPKWEMKAYTTDIERVLTRKAPWITRQLRGTSALPPVAGPW